ncbi:MAG: FtsX-like permease family protein, partial [Phycisphaerae bacterium]|nr:FtsX-like permease family protein [Phycisphaerae bacterium]
IEQKILNHLDPARLGFFFRPVRSEALSASAQGTDFGGLFVGLSFFLVVAALVLTATLFAFGILQRSSETGGLLALGFTPRRVRSLRLQEGLLLAGGGALIGLLLGVLYTRGVLWALANLWQGAAGGVVLNYHASWTTLIGGVVAGLLVATMSMLWILWRQGRTPARILLQSRFGLEATGQARRGPSLAAGLVLILIAALLIAFALARENGSATLVFFAAGALVLLGGLCLVRSLLVCPTRIPDTGRFTSAGLARRNTTRRRGRSLAVITMLACGTFLLVAVNAFRIDPTAAADQRDSGTGGYALFATTVLPVHENMNTAKGRRALNLSDQTLAGTSIEPMRLRPGDDASCLNLNRPQTPALLGVNPAAFQSHGNSRFSFARLSPTGSGAGGWEQLDQPATEDNVIPGIVEDSVATYILHKKLGDTLEYIDERGRPLKIRIVATTSNTILQGHVVISDANFQRHFPSTSGYRVFLVDAPAESAQEVQAELERGLADLGVDVMTTTRRLGLFSRVQNTYLTIFGILGGLGLVLGCVGLGLVVLRNVLERRHELALLRCLGFRRGQLHWLVLAEHWSLLLLGLAIGAISALLAAAPALTRPGTNTPKLLLILTVLGILASGLFWSGLASVAALRGKLITALRQE